MHKHLKYFNYIVHHKWFVLLECIKFGIIWQGIIHDWSKFLPDEWFPYVNYFYGKKQHSTGGAYNPKEGTYEFNKAWLKHQHRNPHHWQYWILIQDEDENSIPLIPDKYKKEMLADWIGAGKAQGYGDNTKDWYLKNRNKMQFNDETKKWIESQLGIT